MIIDNKNNAITVSTVNATTGAITTVNASNLNGSSCSVSVISTGVAYTSQIYAYNNYTDYIASYSQPIISVETPIAFHQGSGITSYLASNKVSFEVIDLGGYTYTLRFYYRNNIGNLYYTDLPLSLL